MDEVLQSAPLVMHYMVWVLLYFQDVLRILDLQTGETLFPTDESLFQDTWWYDEEDEDYVETLHWSPDSSEVFFLVSGAPFYRILCK